eukprot:3306577-Pyramimonas_sp.AAC.1
MAVTSAAPPEPNLDSAPPSASALAPSEEEGRAEEGFHTGFLHRISSGDCSEDGSGAPRRE